MSIWHWLVILIVAAGVYLVYRLANRGKAKQAQQSEGAQRVGPVGVGGWLLLLAAGMLVLGPLFGAGRLNLELAVTEEQYPALKNVAAWSTFKLATWLTFLCVALLSVYGGWGLARGRSWSVVIRAKMILWLIGPVASIALGVVIPLVIFGSAAAVADPQFMTGLISSTIMAAIWTAYLTKSKRVRATYASPPPVAVQSSAGPQP